MWRACWVRLFLTPTKRLKIHAASPSLFLFSVSLQSQFADLISPSEYVYPVVGELHSSPPSSHLSPPPPPFVPSFGPSLNFNSSPSLSLSTASPSFWLFVPLPSSSLPCFVRHPPVRSRRRVNSSGVCSDVLDATEPWGKTRVKFFCGQNRNSRIIFFQSEIKQRSSYKHAADQRESKYSPECVSIVYRALFHSVLWWKSGASAVCRCRKRHFTPLHTHVATHVHAEGVTAVLRCTVTAAVEGKREGKTRGGVFSDLLLLGKEWCHVDLILHKLLEQIKTTIIQKSVDVVSMRMVK